MIQIDCSRCIGCKTCIKDCFPGALTLLENVATLSSPDSCIGCGHCIAVCPRDAVSDDSLQMDDIMAVKQNPVNSDNMLALMRARRSCRHYKKDTVPEPVWRLLIEASRACPTAKNLQGTRYIVVTKQIPKLLDCALSTLRKLGEAQLSAAKDPNEIRRAKNFIRWNKLHREDKDFDPLFFHAPMLLLFVATAETACDAASGAAYAELMAASLGLGCLYSGYFTACIANSPELKSILNLSEAEQAIRCLVVGYPDITFRKTAPRKTPQITML